MRELFDDDKWVKDQFAAHMGKALLEFCEALATCFRLMTTLNEIANRVETKRTALVGAFVFGVLDDILVSTKLLLTGKLPAAGNLMRQVIEGIAMSILCSSEQPLIVQHKTKKKPAVRALYWERLHDGDPCARGFLAISQLEWNAATLGVAAVAVRRLSEAKEYYNAFSHCGTATLTNRVSLEGIGTFYLGGHFDEAKLETYHAELVSRIGLCRMLPTFMEHMIASINPSLTFNRAVVAQKGESS